jgi:hypothetical protein
MVNGRAKVYGNSISLLTGLVCICYIVIYRNYWCLLPSSPLIVLPSSPLVVLPPPPSSPLVVAVAVVTPDCVAAAPYCCRRCHIVDVAGILLPSPLSSPAFCCRRLRQYHIAAAAAACILPLPRLPLIVLPPPRLPLIVLPPLLIVLLLPLVVAAAAAACILLPLPRSPLIVLPPPRLPLIVLPPPLIVAAVGGRFPETTFPRSQF